MQYPFLKKMQTPRKRTYVSMPSTPRKKAKTTPLFKSKSTRITLYKSPTSPVPKQKKVFLRYAETNVSLDPGASVPADYFFRANDLFDPNYTGAGHQPMGFDQWMALYGKFAVLNSKVTVKFSNGADVQSADFIVGVRRTTTPTSSSTNDLIESNACSWAVRERYQVPTLVCAYSHKKEHNNINPEEDSMFGTASASPGNAQYFHVWAVNAATTSDITPVIASVLIEYEVLFFDPIVLSGS